MSIEHGPTTDAGRPRSGLRRLVEVALALCLGVMATPAMAAVCSVTTPVSADVGSFSPAALYSTSTVPSAMPYVATTAAFKCTTSSLVSLFAGDSLVATVKTGTVYTLKSGQNTASYLLAIDPAGTYQLAPGAPRTIVNGTTLSLLSSDRAAIPVYLKANSPIRLPIGTYIGDFEVKWDWSFCTLLGVNALGINVCLGRDIGSASGIVSVTMKVAEKGAIVSISQKTTWEASASTNNPKAIPGSKLRMIVKIENPDIVALDLDTLAITVPTPAGLRVALDGDGTGTGAVVQGANTTGATGLQFTYTSPSSTTDNVDFASGNGVWGYVPTAGDAATQGNVTAVRFNPKGTMAANTAYTISLPYSVK